MKTRLAVTAFSLLLAAPLAACTGDVADGDADPAAAAIDDPHSLLTIALDDDRSVEFREAEPGHTAVVERGPIGLEPLTEALHGRRLAEVYQALRPGESTPAVLVEADARTAALVATATEAPATLDTKGGSGAAFYTTDDHAWFNTTFCNGASQCVHGWDWASADYNAQGAFVVSMLGSEATVNATMNGSWFECHNRWVFPIGLEGVCSWHGDNLCGPQVVIPNHWVSCDYNLGEVRRTHYDITGANGATVSLATKFH
jgi:hypothetical protein